ncbi:MAG: hypothetical protein LRY71_13090 [Bacillaceae bacterium]|nr:hypothetical protein [Bacillaceae bacterium]
MPLNSSIQGDELLYAFIVNKQKLASLLGISILVSSDIKTKKQTNLHKIRSLSMILDDLIFGLYQKSNINEKKIYFHVQITSKETQFDISSPFVINEHDSTNLKLFDALIQFEKNSADVIVKLNPVQLLIRCPLI